MNNIKSILIILLMDIKKYSLFNIDNYYLKKYYLIIIINKLIIKIIKLFINHNNNQNNKITLHHY